MRFELAILALLGCSLNTDLIREPDASADASRDASLDSSFDVGADARDSGLDSSIDAPIADSGPDACSGSETCDGTNEDCDGRIDETPVDCVGSCVDSTCESSGSVLWYATIGSTDTGGVARDRVFGLTATDTTVFAVGDAQGDQLSWTRDAELVGSDGFLLGVNAGGGTSLATMSSGGGDVARDVVVSEGALHVVGVVTGTATFGEGMTSSAGTTGFVARYAPDAEVASDVERLGQTTDLEAVVVTERGLVAVGSVNGVLANPDCTSVDAPGIGVAWAPGRWCTALGDSGDQVFPHDVASGSTGEIYVAGTVGGSANIGGVTVDGGTGTAAFLAKLDGATGAVQWVRSVESMSGAGRAGGNAVAVVDDEPILGGQVDADSGVVAGGVQLGALEVSDEDPFLVGFGATGTLAWTLVDAQSFSGGVLALEVDRDALLVAGWHGGVTFGCEPVASVPGNGLDAFIARLDVTTRDCRWVHSIGSSSVDRTHAIAVDPIRDIVYAGGELAGGAEIRGDLITTVGDESDGFIVAYTR